MTTKIRLNGASATMTRKVDRSTITDRFGNSYSLARSPAKLPQFGAARAAPANALNLSTVSIADTGKVTITGAAGNKYTASNLGAVGYLNFESGRKYKWRVKVDSGVYRSATLNITGLSAIDFTLEGAYYVAEAVIPSGTPTVSWEVVKDTAADMVIDVDYAPDQLPHEKAFLEALVANDFAPSEGNVWPTTQDTFTTNDGAIASKLVWGTTFTPDELMNTVVRLTDSAGEPIMVERVNLTLLALNTEDSAQTLPNMYLERLADAPGYYFGRNFATGLPTGNVYSRLFVYNRSVGGVTQRREAVTAEIQMYRGELPVYSQDVQQSYPATELVVNHALGITDIFAPLNSTNGDYFQYQLGEYKTTVPSTNYGNDFDQTFYSKRTGDTAFAPLHRLTDAGQDSFAMFYDGHADAVGHRVHGYQNRRAEPVMKVTQGGVQTTVSVDTAAVYRCEEFERIDYSEIIDRADDVSIVANLDTTKRWVGNQFYLKQRIQFLGSHDLDTLYLFMWSFYKFLDGLSANGVIFDTVTLPDSPGAPSYTDGSLVVPATANDAHAVYTGPAGFVVDIDESSGWTTSPDSQRWVQFSGGGVKEYRAAVPIASTPHPAPRPAATAVINGDIIEFETVSTISKPV